VAPTDDPIHAGEDLTPTQEEYFLGLFWQSYYTSCPMLDELEFKEHYRSLWATSDEKRKPSALVDIVIAVCMQYGMARLPGVRRELSAASRANVSNTDATIAGRWHYRRCQTLLSTELESPTISMLQCHILCSIYYAVDLSRTWRIMPAVLRCGQLICSVSTWSLLGPCRGGRGRCGSACGGPCTS